MKNVFFVMCYLLPGLLTPDGELKYPVSAIPEELKTGYGAVIREHREIYRILAVNHATLSSFEVITILNEKGSRHGYVVNGYDKMLKIKTFSANVYDAEGKLTRKLKSSEVTDRSAFDGFSLYSDNRLKVADLTQVTYPYTVEIEVEYEYKYLYSIPTFEPVPDEHTSVQKSEYTLEYPAELTPRFKALNISQQPTEGTKDGIKSLKWTFENLRPIKGEPFSRVDLNAKILAAPSRFEYDGYAGNMSSWEEFGKWQRSLCQGRDAVSEATRQKVKEITAGLTTTEQKAKALYYYLQSKTRYVSIAVGIGGLQPFPASSVEENGYGDCKALSNYMVALLKEAGITGYYTTVEAGEDNDEMITDFPSHQANHVIVAVPNGSDTLWLECTSQTNPFGYQGKFTGNRKAMMITETGGKIVNTIKYTMGQNTEFRAGEVSIDKTGNGRGKIKTVYSGLQCENGNVLLVVDEGGEEQKKWLQRNIDIPSFDIRSFSMTKKTDKIPSSTVIVDLQLNRIATVSGKRMFLTPNLMNRSTYVPAVAENRKTDVFLKMAYTDVDTLRYRIPEELYPEFLPPPISISGQFGTYEASFKLEQGTVMYIRRMVRKSGNFPAASYPDLVEFYKKIAKADNIKLVFLTKT